MRRTGLRDVTPIVAVVGLGLLLNALGFGWGMDGYVPWSPDAIEGITVVREMPRLFGQWTYKYPRLQFLIDGMCYRPFIQYWKKHPVYVQVDGQVRAYVLTQSRLKILAMVSRANILIMSSVIIVLVYLIASLTYADKVAAFFAALSLVMMPVFVHYSHTSCVDIPCMLWITAGVYFLLKSIASNRLWHHIFMAVCFAFACSTKDPMLFYAATFAFIYIVLRWHGLISEGKPPARCISGLLNRNVWVALAVFLFVFALLQGILFSPKAYWDRMGVWVWGRGIRDFNKDFRGQLDMLWRTLCQFYSALGWPLLALFLASLAATFRKHWMFNLMLVLLPPVAFYGMVSTRIKMSFIRYYLPVMGLWCLPIGALACKIFATKIKPLRYAAVTLLAVAYGLSLMGCLALDLELIHDSRVQTVAWFEKNVGKDKPALSLIQRIYGPKLAERGYRLIENWNVPSLEKLIEVTGNLPDYIILSDGWPNLLSREADEYKQALLEGKAGYRQVAEFNSKGYDDPNRCILALAHWPRRPRFETVSPRVIVMIKDTGLMRTSPSLEAR